MRLGKCIDLTEFSPVIVEYGGGEGDWSTGGTASAVFTASHPPGSTCDGEAANPSASCTLLLRGCGRVRIHVAGDGAAISSAATAMVLYNSIVVLRMRSVPAGGEECETLPLVAVIGTHDFEIATLCGDILEFSFAGSNFGAPDLECRFTISVLE